MLLKDEKIFDTVKVKGEFSIILEKEDGSIEKYEEKNLIMDLARETMAELLGGFGGGSVITKFVLGTKGHVGDNILQYKRVGENGFNTTRTKTFAEEDKNAQFFSLPFNIKSNNRDTKVQGKGYMRGQDPKKGVTCNIERKVNGRTLTMIYEIPKEAANNPKGDGTIAYTEAAMYCDEKIFSMKTFPARVKEPSVSMKIIWSIIF